MRYVVAGPAVDAQERISYTSRRRKNIIPFAQTAKKRAMLHIGNRHEFPLSGSTDPVKIPDRRRIV